MRPVRWRLAAGIKVVAVGDGVKSVGVTVAAVAGANELTAWAALEVIQMRLLANRGLQVPPPLV